MSELEAEFMLILRALCDHLPEPEHDYRFTDSRRWRFDFAWPDHKIAVELEGGVWTRGRHTRGQGYINDCDKYNRAAIDGWLLLRFTRAHVDDPAHVRTMLDAAFQQREREFQEER